MFDPTFFWAGFAFAVILLLVVLACRYLPPPWPAPPSRGYQPTRIKGGEPPPPPAE